MSKYIIGSYDWALWRMDNGYRVKRKHWTTYVMRYNGAYRVINEANPAVSGRIWQPGKESMAAHDFEIIGVSVP